MHLVQQEALLRDGAYPICHYKDRKTQQALLQEGNPTTYFYQLVQFDPQKALLRRLLEKPIHLDLHYQYEWACLLGKVRLMKCQAILDLGFENQLLGYHGIEPKEEHQRQGMTLRILESLEILKRQNIVLLICERQGMVLGILVLVIAKILRVSKFFGIVEILGVLEVFGICCG